MRSLFAFPLFLAALGTVSAGTIVFQDNLNSAPGSIDNTAASGPLFSGANLSLTGGTIDLLGPGYYAALCSGTGSNYCIDTTGAGAERGHITSTSIFFAPGTYVLSFDLIGWSYQGLTESASVNVTLGNVALGAFLNQTLSVNGASNPYAPDVISFTVASATNASLVFTDTGANDSASFAGGILDNIVIQTTSAPTSVQTTPEPASWILAGSAIAALFILKRSA